MIYSKSSVLFRIINIWFAFVFFLVLISSLPHQTVPLFSWLNCSLYFLLFLLCIFIFFREPVNKAIFVNIGLLCLLYSLSFVNVLIGSANLFGDEYLAYDVFQYRTMLLSFLMAFSVIFICVRYLFKELKARTSYLITLLIVLPFFIWHYYPFLADRTYLLRVDTTVFYKSMLSFTFLPFLGICFYGYLLYKKEDSLGEYINSLMVCFFLLTVVDITDIFGYIYQIKLFPLSQHISLFILSFFILTFFRKLNYAYSDFGQFYENALVAGNYLGVPIKKKKNRSVASFVALIKSYFEYRRNTFIFLSLAFIVCLEHSGLPPYLKLNVIVLGFCSVVLFFYIIALYQKRVRKGELI